MDGWVDEYYTWLIDRYYKWMDDEWMDGWLL